MEAQNGSARRGEGSAVVGEYHMEQLSRTDEDTQMKTGNSAGDTQDSKGRKAT